MVTRLMGGNHTLICGSKLRKKNRKFSIMYKKITFWYVCFVLISSSIEAQYKKYVFETGKMGSPFRIIISTKDTSRIDFIIKEAFHLAEDLENQLSDYREYSDVSKVNRIAGKSIFFPIQKPFKELLLESLKAKKISNGKLNVFSGKLVSEWRKTMRNKILPDSSLLRKVSNEIKGECIEFSKDSTSIRLLNESCQIDFGSIGKGFVAQKVVNFLTHNGFPFVLVDAGGKIVCTQVDEMGGEWTVGLEIPSSQTISPQLIKLKNTSISSSGKTYQNVIIKGKTYSHVLNPKTGWALEHSRSATVISARGEQSDWLATAATILEPNELKRMLKKMKDVKILIWQNNGGNLDIILNHNLL